MIVVRPSVELALLFSQSSFFYFFPSRRLMNELYQRKGIQKQTSFHTAPHSGFSEDALNGFYTKLSSAIEDIPLHSMLFIGSDMNAKIDSPFSFHSSSNRNGLLLLDFINQHNLIVGNTTFQKPLSRLQTHRSPTGSLSQIDFIIYRKRWRNSVHCQAYSRSNPIGSDHRIVTA